MQPVSTHLSSPLARPPSSPNANNDALPLSSEEPSTPEHQQPSLPLPTHDPVQQSHTKQSSSHINIPIIPFSSPQEQVTTHTALYHSQYTPENLFPRLPPSFRLQEADLWIAEAVKADANQFPLAENQVANLPPTSQHLSQEPNFNSFLPSLENYIQSSATELPNLLTQSQTHPKPHTIQPLAPSAVDFNPEQIENINFQGVDLLEAPWPNAPKASNKWSCPSCSFQFAYKDHLARHRAFVHEGKSESKCSHCNKIYVEFKSLRRHINVRPFPYSSSPSFHADIFLRLFPTTAESQQRV